MTQDKHNTMPGHCRLRLGRFWRVHVFNCLAGVG